MPQTSKHRRVVMRPSYCTDGMSPEWEIGLPAFEVRFWDPIQICLLHKGDGDSIAGVL